MVKKSKKKLKGMTLVEIIIALAVFAVISLILCMMGKAVEANRREAMRVNNKVNVQGPVAEAQNGNEAMLINDDFKITVSKDGNDKSKTEITGKLYSTVPYYTDENGNQQPVENASKSNFQFLQIDPPIIASP